MNIKLCSICNKPLDDKRQECHFDCMVDKYKQGDRSKCLQKYFRNRGYSMKDIEEIVNGEWDLH